MSARDREQVVNRLHLGALLRQAVIHAMDAGVSMTAFTDMAEGEYSAVVEAALKADAPAVIAEGSVPK